MPPLDCEMEIKELLSPLMSGMLIDRRALHTLIGPDRPMSMSQDFILKSVLKSGFRGNERILANANIFQRRFKQRRYKKQSPEPRGALKGPGLFRLVDTEALPRESFLEENRRFLIV